MGGYVDDDRTGKFGLRLRLPEYKIYFFEKNTMLYDQIQSDYIEAMKAHETVKKDALNYVFAQCKNKKIEVQKDLEDADVITILKKEIKAREESIWYLQQAGKIQEVEKEQSIVILLSAYLPAMMPIEALTELVKKTAADLGVIDLAKQRGEIVKAIMANHRAEVDGKMLQDIINGMI